MTRCFFFFCLEDRGLTGSGSHVPVLKEVMDVSVIIRMCILFFAPVFFPLNVKGSTFLHRAMLKVLKSAAVCTNLVKLT